MAKASNFGLYADHFFFAAEAIQGHRPKPIYQGAAIYLTPAMKKPLVDLLQAYVTDMQAALDAMRRETE